MRFSRGMKGYFIGIGGVGVNALAKFMLDFGICVSGSDVKINNLCAELEGKGASVFKSDGLLTNDMKSKIQEADFVCYSSAIPTDNLERKYASALGKEMLERHILLAKISEMFGSVVAIGGTHGKTSTTAMVSHILKANNCNFVGIIGGESVDFSNYVNNTGANEFGKLKECVFVCEACEYKQNLLALKPQIAVVTNCELDHPDCYDDINTLRGVFARFLQGAHVKIVGDGYSYLLGVTKRKKAILQRNKYVVEAVSDENIGTLKCVYKQSRTAISFGKETTMLNLKDGGEYSYHNASIAIMVALFFGVNFEDAIKALEGYNGVKRRFEYVGKISRAKVYFDFAHHPSEIKSAIKRAKTFGKITVVFQPHTYSRTSAYLYDFAKALAKKRNGVTALALMPVYGAREQKTDGVDSDVLYNAIFDKFRKKDVCLMQNVQSTIDFVKTHANECDVILMLGAGDIYAIKDKLPLN